MEIILNDYHKKVNAIKIAKVAYWKSHPQSRTESLKKLRLLREQRLASQSKPSSTPDTNVLNTYRSLSPRFSGS